MRRSNPTEGPRGLTPPQLTAAAFIVLFSLLMVGIVLAPQGAV
ncbi:MAG: hypothetical protein AAGC67_15970 [Myxococcota bacterium]